MSSAIDETIKKALSTAGSIPDSLPFAESHGIPHADVIGSCKSLAAGSFIAVADVQQTVVQLSKEGAECAELGSPEARLFALVPSEGGILQDALMDLAGSAGKPGMAKAVPLKWLTVVKEEGVEGEVDPKTGKKKAPPKRVMRAASSVVDTVQQQLRAVLAANGAVDALPDDELAALKKRGLLSKVTVKSLAISKGPMFASWGVKAVADLTHEMLIKGTWKEARAPRTPRSPSRSGALSRAPRLWRRSHLLCACTRIRAPLGPRPPPLRANRSPPAVRRR